MVEPLEFGAVLSGKSWCNSQAIFPKGMNLTNILCWKDIYIYIYEITVLNKQVLLNV